MNTTPVSGFALHYGCVYTGHRVKGGGRIVGKIFHGGDTIDYNLNPRWDLKKMSSNSKRTYDWGNNAKTNSSYQLALALCADVLNHTVLKGNPADSLAEQIYRDCSENLVNEFKSEWKITADEVFDYIKSEIGDVVPKF